MELINHLEQLVSEKISAFKTLLDLMRMEASLAGMSVFPLLLSLILLLVVISSTWLFCAACLTYGIFLWANSLGISLAAVTGVNLLLLGGVIKYLNFNLKSMSFVETRSYFSKQQSNDNEFEKKINCPDHGPGSNSPSTTNESGTA